MRMYQIDHADVSGVLEIYTPFIKDTLVTFELSQPDDNSFYQRVKKYTEKYPWLVMKEGNKVIGYAYASAYREREAYQWCVESSVYVHSSYKKKGIARKLYHALFQLLKLQGIYKVYAVITIPNDESVLFHEKMGFEWFATYKNVGYKHNTWCNVGWWQLILTEPRDSPPHPINLFPKLNPVQVRQILDLNS